MTHPQSSVSFEGISHPWLERVFCGKSSAAFSYALLKVPVPVTRYRYQYILRVLTAFIIGGREIDLNILLLRPLR
jgi:hypothetical protein